MPRKILIVDDSIINRTILRSTLKGDYDILEASNGEEALAIISGAHAELSAVLLDIVMPVMDGYDVLRRMRSDPALSQIPVIITTGTTDGDAEIKALRLGANDFITKPYVPDIIGQRLRNTITLRETAAAVNALRMDRLTGLYNREAFLLNAAELIKTKPAGYYTLACFDIDNFKVINDQFGSEKGDEVLKQVAFIFKEVFMTVGGIVGRITADNFAVLYPTYFTNSDELNDMRQRAAALDGSIPPISFSIGRYVVDDIALSPSAMYDRAALAQESVKGRFNAEIAEYDESLRERLLNEQSITNEMKRALAERQFEVWLQPQYNHSSGALIGAEALVRWRHPQKGLIAPGIFIPLFERNGFVYELDKFVWEETCALLSRWIDAGLTPLPVSVNISRFDILREDLTAFVTGLVAKYNIPANLLRLEVTETAFAKSAGQIISVVKELIDNGFTVEIDDFGSGYSSLNTLKDVPAQIVKLDMRFLEGSDDSGRGGNILESIVRMTKWLGMAVIAEGVETMEQADFLKSIGCNYVQGYLYARPMPVSEYEALVKSVGKEEKLLVMETVENLDNNSFWNPKSMDTLIFNTYVGGACIFEWHNDRIEILRANDKYAKIIGGETCTAPDALNLRWEEHMDEASAQATREAIERAIATGDDVSYEAVYYDLFGNKGKTWLRTTFRAIARATGRYLLYATNVNLTAQRKAEIEKDTASEQLRVIMDSISGGVTAVVVEHGVPRILFANEQFYAMLGFTKEQFENEIDNPHTLTHPDDRERVARETDNVGKAGQEMSIVYRVLRRDGTVRWWQSNITVINLPGIDVCVQLSVANDITALRESERREREISERLQTVMDNTMSGITAIALKGEEVDYLVVNDRYYELHGFTKEQYLAEVKNPFDLIHPDDRQRVYDAAQEVNAIGKTVTLEYRVIRRDGTIAWIGLTISTRKFTGVQAPVQFSVYTDITAEKLTKDKMLESSEQLRFLNDTAEKLLLRSDAADGIDSVLEKVMGYFGADRAYIFEYDYAEEQCVNSYEVCKPGLPSRAVRYRRFPLNMAEDWLRAFETSRFYYMEDSSLLDDVRRDVFESMGVKSTLAVSLRADGRVIGTMGVFNPTLHLTNFNNLAAVGDYMAVILTQRDLILRIERDRENLQNMMNDAPGGFARLRVKPDGSLRAEYVNENYCRLRGKSYDEIIADDVNYSEHSVHPDDYELTRSVIAELIATGETRNIVYRLRHGDDEFIPVNAFGRVSKDEAGGTIINVYYTDLSEQEKRDYQMREMMPHLLSAIMRYSTDLVFAKSRDFKYICCSPAFVKFTRQASESDVIGKTDYDFWTKQEADHFRGDDVKLMESGEPLIDYIEPIPSDDGIQHFCRTSKYILRDGAGEIIGLYGIGRDVTEERTAYEQLKMLTNSIQGGIATYKISPDGIRITYFNDGFCQMIGYTREEYAEISKNGIVNITFEQDVPMLMAQIDRLRRDGTPIDCTFRVRTKQGGIKWVNNRGAITERLGDVSYVNVVLFDVTEVKLAQEAALIHEQEMRLAVSQMSRMLCEYDPATHTLYVPEDFAALYGVPAAVPNVPESLIEARTITEDTLPVYREFYNAILRGEKAGSAEYCDRRTDGSLHWERVEFSNVFGADGKPVKALISVEDTTEMHRRFEMERSRPSRGEANLIAYALFNLTTGETLEYLYNDDSEVPSDDRTALHYADERLNELFINDEERESYRAFNDRETLLNKYESGERELSLDYRRRVPGGEIIWIRNIKRMVLKPGNDDILLFDYFYNIEEEKTQELINKCLLITNYDFIARINGETRAFNILSSQSLADDIPNHCGDDIDSVSRELAQRLVHPDDREMTLRNTLVDGIKANLARDGRFSFTYREVQKDGSVRYKKLTQCYLDRERNLIIAVREDVTALMREEIRKNKLLEAALAAANEESRVKERDAAARLSLILNNVSGGMSVVTMEHGAVRYIFTNKEYFDMLGYTKEQFVAKYSGGMRAIVHPDDAGRFEEAIENTKKYGKNIADIRVFKRDGTVIWVRNISALCHMDDIDAPVYIVVSRDITDERKAADDLRMSEEQFRIAATISGAKIARYDINTGIYHHNDDVLKSMGFSNEIEDMPEAFISKGIISPESADAYRGFFERIRMGEACTDLDAAIFGENGARYLIHADATTIFDGAGKPSQAIIVFSDVTEKMEKEAVYRKWQQSLEQRDKRTYTLFCCNLSKSASYDSMEGSLIPVEFSSSATTFDERTAEFVSQRVYPGDREAYTAFMNSDALLAGYYRNNRIQTLEFRELTPEGEALWRRLTVELVEYPNSSDVEAYLMYEDIDAEKKDELRNRERAETDPLTGILNRVAFAQAVDGIIAGAKANENIALFMLDIDGFKLINDTFGHAMGDQVLMEIAASLRGILRQDDVLGRLGGDEFLICLKNMPNDDAIQSKAGQICTLLHKALDKDVFMSASIGIAVCPRDGSDFETLYRKMDAALYIVKNHGKNNYAFYNESMAGEHIPQTDVNGITDIVTLAGHKQKRRMLIVDDQQVSLTMLSNVFKDEFIIETALNGNDALVLMRRYGASIACVLLDLVMPGMDGFAVLEKMRTTMELQTIPVIVVSGMDEHETSLRTIRCGAADFVTKPVNTDLLRLRVQSAISKAESDRLRAQNSILLMHNTETAKYRAALESAGATVIEYEPASGLFVYDAAVGKYIDCEFGDGALWDILASSGAASADDAVKIKQLINDAASEDDRASVKATVALRTPSKKTHRFILSAKRRIGSADFPERIVIMLCDIGEV